LANQQWDVARPSQPTHHHRFGLAEGAALWMTLMTPFATIQLHSRVGQRTTNCVLRCACVVMHANFTNNCNAAKKENPTRSLYCLITCIDSMVWAVYGSQCYAAWWGFSAYALNIQL
jgi:hypothetical protein